MTERLSSVDASWYRMDEGTNTADIVALITFEEPLDIERVKRIVTQRFSEFPQFSMRVVDPGAGLPYWEEAPDFNITDHIQHTKLQTGTKEELQTFVSGILTQNLHRDRPLWEVHVVDNVVGGGAIVAKIHHCLGDGFALVGVLLSLTDEAIDAPTPAMDAVVESGHTRIVDNLVGIAKNPKQVVEAAKLSGRAAASLGELLLMPFDPDSTLRADLTGIRKAAWSHGIDLQRFKDLARKHGGTINDILLTVLSGALRNWLIARGDTDLDAVRAIVPINLRPADEMGKELGNKFGIVFFEMPIGKTTPTDRFASVRATMNALKQSPQAIVSFGLFAGFGVVPDVVEHVATDIFTRKGSLVVTNVPGPREKITLAGKTVDHVMFWVPHPALLGLGISLLSYAGEVRIGVRADTSITTDPSELIEAFEAELAVLEGTG